MTGKVRQLRVIAARIMAATHSNEGQVHVSVSTGSVVFLSLFFDQIFYIFAYVLTQSFQNVQNEIKYNIIFNREMVFF